jgi:hypothetical protein
MRRRMRRFGLGFFLEGEDEDEDGMACWWKGVSLACRY